jgi:HSP20 family protein
MATTLVEPFAPWLRELSHVLQAQNVPTPFVPPADLLVDDSGVTVYMDVPGLRTEHLEIELENDTLTVRGERRYPYSTEEGRGPVRTERSFGKFERSLRVPGGLDPEAIDASLSDGVLKLVHPQARDAAVEEDRDQGRHQRERAEHDRGPELRANDRRRVSVRTRGPFAPRGVRGRPPLPRARRAGRLPPARPGTGS